MIDPVVERNTILRGIVGSSAYLGSERPGSDRDEMGVFIEAPELVVGLIQRDTITYRDKPNGVRSESGDLDLVLYGLSRFCRLASKGNPSVLMLLHLPETHHLVVTDAGRALIACRSAFYSRDAGARHLGYLRSQKAKLNGERSPSVQRPDLVRQYGYDTKFAMHAVRLGLQGIEYMNEGELRIPMREAEYLRAIRSGAFTLRQILSEIDGLESALAERVKLSTAAADVAAIDRLLTSSYIQHWSKEQND